jgi:endonuclease/exonuclease/phosphatase family metal-dependent hydrolase
VGPFFRDKYWLIHLVAALVVALPFVLIKENGEGESEKQEVLKEPGNSLRPLVLLALSLAIVVTAALVPPIKAAPPSARSLNILTYNIQHGYNDAGEKGFKEQLERIRELDPDILGLQESDVAKMGTGNADLVKYFASGLNMHAYYGPKTVNGTFGIALLSKYPIEDAKTHYMYSIGEQTATIEAKIAVGEQVFNVFVTHLGNKGPIFQQENVLEMVQNRENVILMGDMNFRPPTEQYQITTAVMDDAWLVRWPGGNEDQGIDPERRIDHIFVRLNGGIEVAEATYLPGPESDHPAMMAVLSW